MSVSFFNITIQISTMNKTVRQLIQFLKPLEDDFKCPICYGILQEPHLTTCCGNHHLCKVCTENIKGANGRCPFCQQKPFTGFIDKRFERQLNELKVYCIYRPKGCDWIGKFGEVEQHLNISKENGECQFVVVECPVSIGCKECIPRKNLENHVNNNCKYRQTQCMYCGFVNTYQNVTTSHPKWCAKFPLCCPNKCSHQTYPRNQLGTHLASCPEQEVDCTFSEMGCKEKIKRRVLQEHLDTNLLQHQLIMCQAFKEMKKDKQEVEEQLELLKKDEKELEVKIDMLKFLNQEDNQMKSLKHITKTNDKMQSEYFSKMVELSNVNPVVPIVLKASFEIINTLQTDHYHRNGFSKINHYTAKPYHSQFFYSHSDGYKLQLSVEVICHCLNCRKPQQKAILNQRQPANEWQRADAYDFNDFYEPSYPENLMSFAINLFIFKGDHDSQLEWPFKKEVTITLCYTYRSLGWHDRIMPMDGTEYIPCAVAIFEGNRNHTSTGSKLDIKPVIDKKEKDLQPPQLQNQPYDRQMLRSKLQSRSPTLTDKGLLLPLNLSYCKSVEYDFHFSSTYGNDVHDVYDAAVYFEVTFSP